MTTLDQIRARAEAATEGPWYKSPLGEVYSGTGMSDDPLVADESFDHDAEFIAHSRQDVPALLAAVDAALAISNIRMNSKHGDPLFVLGWKSAIEEVSIRITEALEA